MGLREKAIEELTILIRKVAKNATTGSFKVNTTDKDGNKLSSIADIDLSKKKIPTAVIEEKCSNTIDYILKECKIMIDKELDKRMEAHINKRHNANSMSEH